MTEADIILRDLNAQVGGRKGDEALDFSIAYLKHMESCYHVVGANYSYILESVHNRKAFVFCLTNALQGFDARHEVTSSELYLIIESMCPDFPKTHLTEAVLTATEQYTSSTLSSDHRFPLGLLAKASMCHILYDEWLRALEEVFRAEGKGLQLPLVRIKGRCEQVYRNLPPSCPQPPWAATQCAYDEVIKNGGELSFERFKKAVFGSEAVQAELRLLASYPETM